MNNISLKFILPVTVFIFFITLTIIAPGVTTAEEGIKTSYKQYEIYEYKGEKFLCEPYVVKKDDWLYKIFRRKGVISTANFPLFINIFSNVNPGVSNVDVIEPGASILIPLRKIKKDDYKEKEPGIVQVPVIKYANIPEMFKPYVSKHKVKRGESVSRIIDKKFLNKDGSITKAGIKAFNLSNPQIKNINLIYEDSSVFLPDPEILSKPWFNSLFAKKIDSPSIRKAKVQSKKEMPSIVNEYQNAQLEKYAALIGGNLQSTGNYFFPDENNNMSKIDLSVTPIISLENGQKVLLIPEGVYNKSLIAALKKRWENIKVLKIADAIEDYKKQEAKANKIPLAELKDFFKRLLLTVDFKYKEDSNIKFKFNSMKLSAKVGRIKRIHKQDLLVDFGNILGNAFNAIIEQGNDLISIKPEMGKIKAAKKLLNHLGIASVLNPSFLKDKQVLTIEGLYISELDPEIFITKDKLSDELIQFLKNKNLNKNIKFLN